MERSGWSGKSGRLGTRCTLLRPGIVDYERAWDLQRRVANDVRAGAPPSLILLQHPPTYTLGIRGADAHILESAVVLAARGATVVRSDRGGDVTFHGPGQVVAYPILNLRERGMGPSTYVRTLEQVMIDALASFEIAAERHPGRPGVWVDGAKIAAIGVRISGGVSTHGFAVNVSTDLSYFDAIVPCGIADAGVTSIEQKLQRNVEIAFVERTLVDAFGAAFGLELTEESLTEAHVGR